MSNFVTVKVSSKNNNLNVQIEKGCSFENKGAIYRVDEKGALNIFDKDKQTWTKGSKITMNDYQIQTFMAVANNHEEKINGKKVGDIVLSKKDIDVAMEQHKSSKIKGDLSEFLAGNYEVKDVQRYSNFNAFAAYVANENPKTSGNLVFKYGSADDAVTLSGVINKIKTAASAVVNKVLPKKENRKTGNVSHSKEHNTTTQTNKRTNKAAAHTATPHVKPATKKVGHTVAKAHAKVSHEKHHYNRSKSTPIPDVYKKNLANIAKQMGISQKKLEEKIVHVAKKTGYSEYFIKHIIAMECYEPKVRNTGDGTITGGFGHSGLRERGLKEGQKVSVDKAFKWLEGDIKFFEKKVKSLKLSSDSNETIGDYFNKLPLSVREAIIDVAFNRDANKIESSEEFRSLRANIKGGNENLPATVVRLCQDFSHYSFAQKKRNKFTTGLMYRNTYRFLLGIRDLDDNYRNIAKTRFENYNNYYSTTIALKKAKNDTADVKMLQRTWNSF